MRASRCRNPAWAGADEGPGAPSVRVGFSACWGMRKGWMPGDVAWLARALWPIGVGLAALQCRRDGVASYSPALVAMAFRASTALPLSSATRSMRAAAPSISLRVIGWLAVAARQSRRRAGSCLPRSERPANSADLPPRPGRQQGPDMQVSGPGRILAGGRFWVP